jgi:hypothetical protein
MYKLADRLTNLPLILAGPRLRRVTDKSVTVWIVVRQSANVTLEIYSGDPGRRTLPLVLSLYKPGEIHAREATKHAITFIRRVKNDNDLRRSAWG